MRSSRIAAALAPAALLIAGACTHHEIETKSQVNTTSEVKPIEIKPIHITIDINVKVDKALDNFFGDLDRQAEKAAPAAESKLQQQNSN